MQLYVLKGIIWPFYVDYHNENHQYEVRDCGSYFLRILNDGGFSFITNMFNDGPIEKSELKKNFDYFNSNSVLRETVFFNIPFESFFSEYKKGDALLSGSGSSYMECVIDLLDKAAFFPITHYGEDLSEIRDEKKLAVLKPYINREFDTIHERKVFSMIEEKDRLVMMSGVSRRTIHSLDMYKKTYITVRDLFDEYGDTIKDKSDIYVALLSLLCKNYIALMDKVPKYPIPANIKDIKTFVIGNTVNVPFTTKRFIKKTRRKNDE